MKKNTQLPTLIISVSCLILFILFSYAAAFPQKMPNYSEQKKENPDLIFEGLSFRYVSEGKTQWTLFAKKGILNKNKLEASLDEIEFKTIPPALNKNYLILKSPKALYNLNQSEIFAEEPRSVLFLDKKTIKFQSSEFFLDLKNNFLRSERPVQLDYGRYRIQADVLQYDLGKNTLKINKNFQMKYD